MPYTPRAWTDGELVIAEDLNRIEQGLTATTAKADAAAEQVDKIKLANQSAGIGAPTGTAPTGWVYTDIATGDIYRMEAGAWKLRLTQKSYDSGLMNITAAFPGTISSGTVWLHIRSGIVTVQFDEVVPSGTGDLELSNAILHGISPSLPQGNVFGMLVTKTNAGRRVLWSRNGRVIVYGVGSLDTLYGTLTWTFRNSAPVTIAGVTS